MKSLHPAHMVLFSNRTLCLRIAIDFQVLHVLENTLTARLDVRMLHLLSIDSCISRPNFLTVPSYMELAGKSQGLRPPCTLFI
jgi:hypothetical protein